MTSIRKTAWFLFLAVGLAFWMGALVSLRGVAEAGVIASHGAGGDLRVEDIAKVQSLLERKVVAQWLVDYGVSPEEAMAKIRSLDERDLHRLASLTDRAGAGADDGLDILIGIAVLFLLIIVILKLMHKQVIVR